MEVLILGNNEINNEVGRILEDEGLGFRIAEDVSALSGSVLSIASESGGKINGFSPVIITEPLVYEALSVSGEKTINLMDDAEVDRLIGFKTSEIIVILLDYEEETPWFITAGAVGIAKLFADVKKKVVLLSKTIKSGYDGGEAAFRAARNAGVTFIKYESAELGYDEETDRFEIETGDGMFSFQIDTPYVLTAVVREVSELKSILKKLRLYRKADGRAAGFGINDDRFFLYPAFTTRLGVYYINPVYVSADSHLWLKQDKGDGSLCLGDAYVSATSSGWLQDTLLQIISDIKVLSARNGFSRDAWGRYDSVNSDVVDRIVPSPSVTSKKQSGICWEPEIVRGWSYPVIDSGKCAFCYSCFRACPHGALEPDMEVNAMKVVEPLCQACGTCVAICPGEAITNANVIAKGVSYGGKCKIYLCENGAAQAFEKALPLLGEYGESIDAERVACGGSVGADKLAADLSEYDTLIIACCIEDACRHMDGDKRACKQAARATASIMRLGIGGKRVAVINVSHAMKNVMRDKIMGILEGEAQK